MIPADGIGGRERVVRQPVVLGDLPYQARGGLPVGQLFTQERVEHGAGGVSGLQLVLNIQCSKDIVGVSHREVRAVGVVRGSAGFSSSDDVGIDFHIVLRQTVGGGLCRGCLEVVEIPVLLLIIAQALAHVIQHITGEFLAPGIGHVCPDPFGVQAGFVHTHQADGGEVVVKGTQIMLGIGIEAFIQELCDDFSLDFQGAGRDVHQLVQTRVKVLLILCEIGQTRHVQRNDTDRAGALARAEESAGFLAQLAQVKAQAAAHGTDIGGLHVGVDIVGEIGCPVLCGHLEEQLIVLRGGPVKVARDGIGRNRVLETASVAVAFDHELDESLVDHIHLRLAVAVGEVHFPAADDGGHILQIRRDGPVKRDVGKRCLRAPAGGGIHAKDEALNALLDFRILQVVDLYERGKVGVEGGESLRTRPLVLHDAEEIHHLVAKGGEVACGGGVDLARDSEAFGDQLFETPACTVTGQHAQIVQVQVAVAVRIRDLLIVDLAQPVVCGNRTGVGEDQSADGIGNRGVLLHTPVRDIEVLVDGLLIVQIGVLEVAHFLALLAVEDVGLADLFIPPACEHRFGTVLDVFDGDETVFDLRQKVRRDLQCQEVNHTLGVIGICRLKCLFDGICDFIDIETDNLSVSLYYVVHGLFLPIFFLPVPLLL